MVKQRWPLFAASLVALAATSRARAQDAPPSSAAPAFGSRGQTVISAASTLGVSSTEYSGGNASHVSVDVSPGIDQFVLKNLSVGVDLSVYWATDKGYVAGDSLLRTETTGLGIGPRFGLNLPLGDYVSIYLRATLGMSQTHTSRAIETLGPNLSRADAPAFPSDTERAIVIRAFAPLLLHLAPHAFIGFGPAMSQELSHSSDATSPGLRRSIGASFVVGGWF